ncbi:MAG: glycosyltransferase family 39 protein, partial [Bacteroidota bacterium]|nr:glycosyltransferase family 39 protein [Bacteroidota bacterium]
MTFRNKIRYLILLSFLLRLIVAATTELGNDEVYYYTYALHLQWNYFDHPPGVALLILTSSLNLLFTHELFVRLGAIVCAAIGTALCYAIGKKIRNERTGWYAAVLYNTSLYTSIIAGTFILPDSPQVVCWLAGLFLGIKMIQQFNNNMRVSIAQWLLFGVINGLCIQCKIHGVFLWFGLGLYILFYARKVLSQPGLYLSFLLTLLIISPIIYWNINNHFITFTYHSNRLEVHHFSINFNSFLQAFFGQIFYNNPVNVFLTIVALFLYKTKRYLPLPFYRMLLLTGLPIIVVVVLLSFFNPVLPHWSGPGFLSLSFIAAAYLDARVDAYRFSLPAILKSSMVLILIVVIGGM